MASIFKKRILQERLEKFSVPNMEGKLTIIQKWLQAYKDGHLQKKGEKEAEQEFIQHIFVEVLDHTRFPDSPYTVYSQAKTLTSGQKPDAILGYFENEKEAEKVALVCEIKDCNTPLDKSQRREGNLTPIQQAFKYKTQYKSCDFVLATNFFEIRLLKENELNFDKWTLETLVDPTNDYFEFRKFYYLLCQKNLVAERGKSVTLKLLSDIQIEQEAITKEFYQLYKELRQKLIKNILAKNGTGVTKGNFYSMVVEKAQKIIDRIVFVAFCEDLGLLPENILQKVIESDNQTFSSTWDTVKGFFKAVDVGSTKLGNPDGYNGELFKPDEDLDKLIIDDDICNEFLKIGLYDFSEDLSVNILGHIFEQSISDLEKLKSIGEEEVDDSTSKRKKDGIFYTPEYIVDYIVQNSVGAWLKEQEKNILEKHGVKADIQDKNYEKRHREAYEEYQTVLQNIKVLDPACGSGAFLVKVFDYLLEENKRVVDVLAQAQAGAITFFDTERSFKEILQNNIYGVDLNPESVEITKLSLWLKTAQKGKKLTTLKNNIKCGNSLIDDPTVAGERAFKWEEGFKEIMDEGGFDVVVGNPPYGAELNNIERNFLKNKYDLVEKEVEVYIMFIQKVNSLLKDCGRFAFITPSTWLTMFFYKKLRKHLLDNYAFEKLALLTYKVFEDATVETSIFCLKKEQPATQLVETITAKTQEDLLAPNYQSVLQVNWLKSPNTIINLFFSNEKLELINKIFKTSKPLSEYLDVKNGTKPYCKNKGTPKQTSEMIENRVYDANFEKDKSYKRYLTGKDFNRWVIFESSNWIKYGDCLAEPRDFNFEQQKIIVRQTADRLISTIDQNGFYNLNNVHNLLPKDTSINLFSTLCILNSRLLDFALSYLTPEKGRAFAEVKAVNLKILPIKYPKDNSPLEAIAKNMLELNKVFQANLNNAIRLIKHEFHLDDVSAKIKTFYQFDFDTFINATGSKNLDIQKKSTILAFFEESKRNLLDLIDKIRLQEQRMENLVFELYGLTDEERQIVLDNTTIANA